MLRSDHFTASTLRILGAATLAGTLLAGPALASGSCCAKASSAAASCEMKQAECAPGAKSATAVVSGRKTTAAKRAVAVRRSAGSKPVRVAKTSVSATKSNAVSAGMRVAIDPETHLPLKPSAGQRTTPVATEGAASPIGATDGVTVRILPDGTKLIDLGESLMQYSVARKDASGKFRFDCAPSVDEARKLAAKPPKPVAPVAVEK